MAACTQRHSTLTTSAPLCLAEQLKTAEQSRIEEETCNPFLRYDIWPGPGANEEDEELLLFDTSSDEDEFVSKRIM